MMPEKYAAAERKVHALFALAGALTVLAVVLVIYAATH